VHLPEVRKAGSSYDARHDYGKGAPHITLRRVLAALGSAFVLTLLFIPAATPGSAAGKLASLQATIDTAAWLPPSPDPSGIAWWADKGRLIVADGEVEETIGGITHYQGVNLWETTTAGTVVHTSTTYPAFSSEPTDVAANGSTVYVIDDNADMIFMIDVGGDGELGTADDTRTTLNTRTFNSHDPEGVAFGAGSLFVSDGNNNQEYRVDPGQDGLLGGVDDRVSCFDTSVLGMRDPEGVTMDPVTGELVIVSRTDREMAVATPSGQLSDLISLAGVLPFTTQTVNPAGVAMAPVTDDPSRYDAYISDRAVDNNNDPNEVDGKVYEVRLSDPTGNRAPVVSGPGAQTVVEGEGIRLQIAAADPNDDPITYSAANLPPGLSVDPSTGVVSGTIAAGAAVGSPYASTLRGSDGTLIGSRNASWTVTATGAFNTAPTVTNPGDQTGTEGDTVSLPITATDLDAGNVLMYSATGLPPGLWLDCVSGVIAGTIAPGAASGSPYSVQVRAGDQVVPGAPTFHSKWDSTSFTWSVGGSVPDDPPAAPTGLTVTPDTGGLRLDWANNTELDLAGYNVYRMVGGSPVKLNGGPLTSSDFYDPAAPPGETSTYRVTAVDLAGHESAPTEGSGTRGTIVSRGASTATTKSANSLTVARPAGVQSGDVMFAAIAVNGSPASVTPPPSGGWTLLRQDQSGSVLRQYLFWKVAGAEPPNYTWSFPAKFSMGATITAYGGVDTSSPFANAGRVNASSLSITANGFTAASGDVFVGFFGIATNTTIAPDARMLEQAEALQTQGSKKLTLEAADDVIDLSGATGTRVATGTSGKAAVNIGQSVLLHPAP